MRLPGLLVRPVSSSQLSIHSTTYSTPLRENHTFAQVCITFHFSYQLSHVVEGTHQVLHRSCYFSKAMV